MKKIVFIALALLFIASYAQAAAVGTCTQSITDVGPIKTLTFVCIASADDASFPSTTVTTARRDDILGYKVTQGRTYPGAVSATSLTSTGTNPTALYDIALTDAGGLSLMTITDSAAATPAGDIPALKAGVYGGVAILDAPVFAITGNAVNSANVVVRFVLER